MEHNHAGALAHLADVALEATYEALGSPEKPLEVSYKSQPTLTLLLFHGRKAIEEQMDDWGFDAPLIKGIVAMSNTYGSLRLHFADAAAMTKALAQTGWEIWDENCLKMEVVADLVYVNADGDISYYGDFHLYIEGTEDPEVKPDNPKFL